MTNNDDHYERVCRFCGVQKSNGKYIFNIEAVEMGLLTKIKSLFPEEVVQIYFYININFIFYYIPH